MPTATYSVFLRWNPLWKHQSAFGTGYINYISEVEAPNLAEAKALAEEFQKDMDLGYLELLLTKGKLQRTFGQESQLGDAWVMGVSSSIYHYPSRKDIPEKANRSWSKIAPKGGLA